MESFDSCPQTRGMGRKWVAYSTVVGGRGGTAKVQEDWGHECYWHSHGPCHADNKLVESSDEEFEEPPIDNASADVEEKENASVISHSHIN